MKNLKTKVILSGIVLVFALIATIGSTFAWFTVAQSVEVQSMELNVQAADSMLVKVYQDGEVGTESHLLQPSNYSTTLTNQDFIDAGYDFTGGGTTPWTLQPVTAITGDYASVDVVNLNTMVANDSNLTRDLEPVVPSTDMNLTGGKYIELRLWILSQSTSIQEVVLQDLTINPLVSNTDLQDDIVNAVRMGVYADTVSTSENIFGLDTDYAYDFADYSAQPGYWDSVNDPNTTSTLGTYKFNNLTDLHNEIITTFDPAVDQNDDWYDSANDITTGSPINKGAATGTKINADTVFSTPAYAGGEYDPILVVFKIFVEGWDAQTNNNVISSAFTISFKFAFKNI